VLNYITYLKTELTSLTWQVVPPSEMPAL